MQRLRILALVLIAACGEEREAERPAAGDTLAGGELALPPSADAPRSTAPGRAPDTVAPEPEAVVPAPVTPAPTPTLDVGAIASAYREYYRELFLELGSDVRGGVDPELVEEAKRRTALDFGYVEVRAWNNMVRDLTGAQRSVLAEQIASINRDLGRELHTGPMPPSG